MLRCCRSCRSLCPLRLALLLVATLSAPAVAGNNDGLLDDTFGGDGVVTWYDGGQVTVADLATSSTGAYAVGTVTLVGEEPALHFKGFDHDGGELGRGCAQTSDTLFTLATESNGLAGLIDSGGDLVVGGWAAFFGTESTHRALVTRFDLSGTGCNLDDGFSGNGWAIFNATTWCDTENCEVIDLVEIRPETGYVVAPRIVALVRAEQNLLSSRLFLLALTGSGAVDTSFSGDGWKEVDESSSLGPLYPEASLALDGIGRIYVLGARYEPDTVDIDSFVIRYQINGEIDPGFGVVGTALIGDLGPNDSADHLPRGVDIAADGVVAAVLQREATEAVLVTYRSANEGGGVPLDQTVAAVAIQGNGRVVEVGDHGDGSDGFQLGRYVLGPLGELQSDGAFGSFGGAHNYDLDLGGSNSETVAAVAIWNGRILVAGTAASSVGNAGFLLRTRNNFVFADGFEQGTAAYWSSSTGVVFPD